MMSEDPVDLGLRKAALAIHALQPNDQSWLMSALSAPQRAALEPLLDELRSLAMPPDGEVIRHLLSRSQKGTQQPAVPSEQARARAVALGDALSKEPSSLQGLFLAALPDMEQRLVLAQWQGVPPKVQLAPMAPALRDAIGARLRGLEHAQREMG